MTQNKPSLLPTFRLRTLLIVVLVAGAGIGLLFRYIWQPHYRVMEYQWFTPNGVSTASALLEANHYGHARLINVLVIYDVRTYRMSASKPNREPAPVGFDCRAEGIYRDGQLIGGYGDKRMILVLNTGEVRTIPLDADDEARLISGNGINKDVVLRMIEPHIRDHESQRQPASNARELSEMPR